MSHTRYGLRIIALVGLGVLGLVAGIWLSWPRERRSAQELLELLPPGGTGQLGDQHDRSVGGGVPPSAEDCAPGPAIHQFRTTDDAAVAGYALRGKGSVTVRIMQLNPDEVGKVHAALRSATHCQWSVEHLRILWTKIDRPWFGDVSALFTEARVSSEGPSRPTNGEVWAFSASGDYLVMINANLTTVETVAEVYRQLFAELDRELDTKFLRPNESVGGCRPANLDIENLPPTAFSINELLDVQAIHDWACREDARGMQGTVPQGLIVDSGFVTSESSGIEHPAELARTLETRGVYRNGAVSYRSGDSAVVFSTYPNENSVWDAYVRQCSTAAGQAAQRCGPDPYGPLGGTDWVGELSGQGCPPYETDPLIEKAYFQDLTGDGYPEPVLLVVCHLSSGEVRDEVRVYDGRSPSDSPRLIQGLAYSSSLNPYYALLVSDTITVVSDLSPPNNEPNSRVTDRFQWQGRGFVQLSRDVTPY